MEAGKNKEKGPISSLFVYYMHNKNTKPRSPAAVAAAVPEYIDYTF